MYKDDHTVLIMLTLGDITLAQEHHSLVVDGGGAAVENVVCIL